MFDVVAVYVWLLVVKAVVGVVPVIDALLLSLPDFASYFAANSLPTVIYVEEPFVFVAPLNKVAVDSPVSSLYVTIYPLPEVSVTVTVV